MKKIRVIILLLAGLSTTSCSFGAKEHELTVTDGQGQPLKGIAIKAGYTGQSGKSIVFRGTTDANGRFSFSADAKTEISFTASADGYYSNQIRVDSTGKDDRGYATPQSTQSTLTLNSIRNPVPLIAYRSWELNIPIRNEQLGYDIELGDWISPYGEGKSADIFFVYSSEYHGKHDYNGKLEMSFPNENDGYVEFSVDFLNGSELKSKYQAPASGYLSTKTWEFQRRSNVMFSNTGERTGNFNDYNEPTSYWLRLRTVVDENGSIKEAIYAKIYRDIKFGGVHEKAFIKFASVYVNPVINDRNLEFDHERNLFENLPSKHRPRYP